MTVGDGEGMGPRIREDTGGPIGAETRLALAVKRINASDYGRLRIRGKGFGILHSS